MAGWELCATAFELAIITYQVQKLPVLYFSFEDRINGFLYCKLQDLYFCFLVWIAAELLIWLYFCQILGYLSVETVNSWFLFLDRRCSNTCFGVSLAAFSWSLPTRQSNEKLADAPYLFGQSERIVSWVVFAERVGVCLPVCCVTQPMRDLLIPSSSERFGRQWQWRLGNPLQRGEEWHLPSLQVKWQLKSSSLMVSTTAIDLPFTCPA